MVIKKDYTGTIITAEGLVDLTENVERSSHENKIFERSLPDRMTAATTTEPKIKLTPKSQQLLKVITAKGFQTIE